MIPLLIETFSKDLKNIIKYNKSMKDKNIKKVVGTENGSIQKEIEEEQNNYSIKNLLNKKQERHDELMEEILKVKKEVKKIRKIMIFNKVIIFIIVILIALGVQIGIKFLEPVFEDYARSFNSTMEAINNISNN